MPSILRKVKLLLGVTAVFMVMVVSCYYLAVFYFVWYINKICYYHLCYIVSQMVYTAILFFSQLLIPSDMLFYTDKTTEKCFDSQGILKMPRKLILMCNHQVINFINYSCTMIGLFAGISKKIILGIFLICAIIMGQ